MFDYYLKALQKVEKYWEDIFIKHYNKDKEDRDDGKPAEKRKREKEKEHFVDIKISHYIYLYVLCKSRETQSLP